MSDAAVQLPPRSARARSARRPSVGSVISIIVLTLGAIGMLAPFLYMLITALKTAAHAYDLPPDWYPTEFHWKNFDDAINGPLPLLRNMWNSFFIATLTTLGMLITAPMAGYAFARLRFPGQSGLFVLLLASLMVPIQVTVIPLFLIMRNLHLIDTPWSLILPGIILKCNSGLFLYIRLGAAFPNAHHTTAAFVHAAHEKHKKHKQKHRR